MSQNGRRGLDTARHPPARGARRRGRSALGETARAAHLRVAQSPHPLAPEARSLLQQGVTVVVATRDGAMHPHIARGWGPEALGQHGPVRFCIEAPDGSATARNLVEHPEIAVTLTRPATYQSIQLKGLTIDVRTPTDDELQRVDEHQAAFSVEAQQVGIPPRLVPRLIDRSSLLSVTVAVDELYDQTPGRAAGTAM